MDIKCDKTDQQILDILRNNARSSYSDIGSKIGISRVAVANRIRRMEQDGIISGYYAHICEQNAALRIEFLMQLEITAAEYENILALMKKQSFIDDIWLVSGKNAMVVKGHCNHTDFIGKLVHELLSDVTGISDLTWNVISSNVKTRGENNDDERGHVLTD